MQEATITEISPGETILLGVVTMVMVTLTVFGLLVTRRAVYSAVCVIVDMVRLAVLYTAFETPFMGVVQIAVCMGAILMVFLFVPMMIGVDTADSTYETLRGQCVMVALGALGFAAIVGGVVMDARTPGPIGLVKANEETNPTAITKLIFTNRALTTELTGAFLIVAAAGATTLTRRQGVRKRLSQVELADAKMVAYAQTGCHTGQKPLTGIYVESNSAAAPALTSGGEAVAESVLRILRARGQAYTSSDASPITAVRGARGELDGRGREVPRAHIPGMPGEEAPSYGDSREEVPAYGDPHEEPPVGGSPDRPRLDDREENR